MLWRSVLADGPSLVTIPLHLSGWWLGPTGRDLVTCLPGSLCQQLCMASAVQPGDSRLFFSWPFPPSWCNWCWCVRVFCGSCGVGPPGTLAWLEEPSLSGILFTPQVSGFLCLRLQCFQVASQGQGSPLSVLVRRGGLAWNILSVSQWARLRHLR